MPNWGTPKFGRSKYGRKRKTNALQTDQSCHL